MGQKESDVTEWQHEKTKSQLKQVSIMASSFHYVCLSFPPSFSSPRPSLPCHFPLFFYSFLFLFLLPSLSPFSPNGKNITLYQGNTGYHLFTVAYVSVGGAHSFKSEHCNDFINVIDDL